MILSFEQLLALGIVVFYLVDSALLLYGNELIYLHRAGRWTCTIAPHHWRFARRYLYLPNPLHPGDALFRFSWSAAATSTKSAQLPTSFHALLGSMASLAPALTLLGGLLLVALPTTLLFYGTGRLFLLILGFVYLAIGALLLQIYRRRKELGVDGAFFAKMAFDALACAPLALNLSRRIARHYTIDTEAIEFARQQFVPEEFSRLIHLLTGWIDQELAFEEPQSARYRAMDEYRNRLRRMES